jgi:hypothetical protein
MYTSSIRRASSRASRATAAHAAICTACHGVGATPKPRGATAAGSCLTPLWLQIPHSKQHHNSDEHGRHQQGRHTDYAKHDHVGLGVECLLGRASSWSTALRVLGSLLNAARRQDTGQPGQDECQSYESRDNEKSHSLGSQLQVRE